jgi:hypothetical protein
MVSKLGSIRFPVFFLLLVLGTWFGKYMQGFNGVSPYFRDVVDFTFDMRRIDLVVVSFGLFFSLKLNLGTLIGCIAGLLFLR